jgi:hypothetical protein
MEFTKIWARLKTTQLDQQKSEISRYSIGRENKGREKLSP